MNKRILFVDDEQQVLEGLRRSLRRQRKIWDMAFVDSGEKALEELAKGDLDVVVTDMRMPLMDGGQLLREVKHRHPDTVRIVLSGHAEFETTLRSVALAHRFVNKPCEPEQLQEVVERVCGLRDLLSEETLREAVGEVDALPMMPAAYAQICELVQDPEVGIGEVAEVIDGDIALCSKILQVVNSSFFGLAQQVPNVRDAVSYLGIDPIKNMVLSLEVFRPYEEDEASTGKLDVAAVQTLGQATGRIARILMGDAPHAEDGYVAGLLHDMGVLVMASKLPERFDAVRSKMRSEGCPMYRAEEALYGAGHAEMGAYLLGIWGLPNAIVEAVANHHRPDRVEHSEFDLVTALHVADALASALLTGAESERLVEVAPIDHAYLERLGVHVRLPEWVALAVEVVDEIERER